MIRGFNVGALKTVKIVTFVASANAQKSSISGRLLSLLEGSKWGVNENLRNNKEAGSPEQQYKRDNAQLSAPARPWEKLP